MKEQKRKTGMGTTEALFTREVCHGNPDASADLATTPGLHIASRSFERVQEHLDAIRPIPKEGGVR
jgi:hypothetical protein